MTNSNGTMKSMTNMDQRYSTSETDHFLIAPLTDFDGGARAGTAVNDEPPLSRHQLKRGTVPSPVDKRIVL